MFKPSFSLPRGSEVWRAGTRSLAQSHSLSLHVTEAHDLGNLQMADTDLARPALQGRAMSGPRAAW